MAMRTALFFGSSGVKANKDRTSQYLLADLFRQGQAKLEIDGHADPLQLAEVYTAAIILTATNWLTNWWGDSNESLTERLLHAVAIVMQRCRTRRFGWYFGSDPMTRSVESGSRRGPQTEGPQPRTVGTVVRL